MNSKNHIQSAKTTKDDEAVRVRKPVLVLEVRVTVVVLTVVVLAVEVLVTVVVLTVMVLGVEVLVTVVCIGLLQSSLDFCPKNCSWISFFPKKPGQNLCSTFFQKQREINKKHLPGGVFNGNEFRRKKRPKFSPVKVEDVYPGP